ncbi:MAG: alginate lyase family protein [Paraburkholderia sp.]|nr:alginate lyase family protein [Paraburkholderia sp.]
MNRPAFEPGSTPNVRRRQLLGAAAAVPTLLLMSMLPRAAPAQAEDVRGLFVLSSAERAAQIRERVSAGLADPIRALADAGLAREPHPRAVVHTQGLLPKEQDHDASQLSQEDWRQTLTQGLAWCITGNAAYAARAVAYINAWIPGYTPSFNPIDETDLVDLLLGFDFVQDRLPPSTVAQTRQLGRELATGYLGARRAGDLSTGLNNWQSHRIKLATAGAWLSGDAALIAAARAGFIAHVSSNIDGDGLTYDFNQRDAMHYVVYDLEPLLMAASIAAAHGDNWYGAVQIEGRLAAALKWLAPFALGREAHQEFVHSTVKFDARRAAAHVEGYAGLWQRHESSDLYWIASRLDQAFLPVSNALEAKPVTRALFA